MEELIIGRGIFLHVSDCLAALKDNTVMISGASVEEVQICEKFLIGYINDRKKIYGINTQFGDQVHHSDPFLESDETSNYLQSIHERQNRLVRSHNCGMGPPVSPKIVKLSMLLRTHCLAQGYSGVSLALINKLLEWINSDTTPLVYTYGSIGASGDLIPLATIAAAIIGEPVEVLHNNKVVLATTLSGIKPYQLKHREGLALINGTSFMTAIATLAFADLKRLFTQMIHLIGMLLEVHQVNAEAYDPLLHRIKGHVGSIEICKILQPYMETSRKHNAKNHSIQNYYSLRSVCQGFGPFYENLVNCEKILETEINSVNDNPIVDREHQQILHGANFMGYYITEICDLLKMDIAQASTWLHALLANLYHPRKNNGLPTNLMKNPALYNGFRPLQLLAAALTIDNRKFAQAQQAYMLPTEGDNQDVNSLGTHAAFDLQKSVENLEKLCAIIYLSAAQAWEFRDFTSMSEESRKLYETLRQQVAARHEDQLFQPDLEKVVSILK